MNINSALIVLHYFSLLNSTLAVLLSILVYNKNKLLVLFLFFIVAIITILFIKLYKLKMCSLEVWLIYTVGIYAVLVGLQIYSGQVNDLLRFLIIISLITNLSYYTLRIKIKE